ncbi:hypothetical protein GSI_08787 [Ganoderma sinense ZZ0214-1]|uniref:Uncharacterized protein n=1 Tax=Ganoderma sinense ZZ0214-1 TaxID=1077348 RepID=A0A2G8S4P0_9APHY|nr:hypothetical protein GSI_08759 [Ganoderma sinense ZZ0214-1]PIL28721.1 hypothetical protein GSI_08765 [Ganoderma sinense ZZ0214-1]PIL28743.1 hypothetical protein GSI_08787 [Ganoderma sinense ZZ0214-1]
MSAFPSTRRQMLASSPGLSLLSLHYSGTRARTSGSPSPDGIEGWSADLQEPNDTIAVHGPGYQASPATDPPRLQKLIDLEVDYLVAVLKLIDARNVHRLHLERSGLLAVRRFPRQGA